MFFVPLPVSVRPEWNARLLVLALHSGEGLWLSFGSSTSDTGDQEVTSVGRCSKAEKQVLRTAQTDSLILCFFSTVRPLVKLSEGRDYTVTSGPRPAAPCVCESCAGSL